MSMLATGDWLDWYAPGTEPKITEESIAESKARAVKMARDYHQYLDQMVREVYESAQKENL